MTRPMVNPLALNRKFGQRVKQIRSKHKLSQAQLGSLLGVTRASVANLEGGKQRIVIDTLYNLAYAFKMKPCQILV